MLNKKLKSKKHNIIITNDDGIDSPGLHAMAKALASLGNIYIIAPNEEKSAIGHSVTIHHPLRAKILKENVVSLFGTPADCIIFGVLYLLKKQKIDLIASGINLGPNLGDDVTYSGTIGAAMEGTLLKIPSIAVSLTGKKHNDFSAAISFTNKIAKYVIKNGLPEMTLLNINVPNEKVDNIKGYLLTKQGKGIYRDNIVEKVDPRGRKYFWIDGDEPRWELTDSGDTDFYAVANNYISVTPLSLNLTNYSVLETMREKINIRF
ncbi:MAG: 5'/3'-nucleotidase SurE [Candidatus Firestonebacteria bacterium]|nr:5'/3'-nucleotidase SurE [Candidatus Firestonebacteria bacterium]